MMIILKRKQITKTVKEAVEKIDEEENVMEITDDKHTLMIPPCLLTCQFTR